MADVEHELFSVDERATSLGAIARRGSRFLYEYDFGDDWRHEIHVERVDFEHDTIVRCTGGARACPPEDCGGPHGYAHLLEVLDNPAHAEYANMKQWAPRRFNPERFDVSVPNRKLAALSRRRYGRARIAGLSSSAPGRREAGRAWEAERREPQHVRGAGARPRT